MKASLLVFILGMIAGAFALHYYEEHQFIARNDDAPIAPAGSALPPVTHPSIFEQARNGAVSTGDAISDKLAEWHLTGPEIRDDLARTGQVVRAKAKVAGEKIAASTDNARVVTIIKAKYTLDKDLSARAIEVDANAGQVTLRGKVASPELVAKAVAFALDTEGVAQVTSLLTVGS